MTTLETQPYRRAAAPPVQRRTRGRLATVGVVLGGMAVLCHVTLVASLFRGWPLLFWTMLLAEHALGVGAIVAAGMARTALLAPGEPDCIDRVSRAAILGAIGFGAPMIELTVGYAIGMIARYLPH